MARKLIKDVRKEERAKALDSRHSLMQRIWKLQAKLGMAKEEIKALKSVKKSLEIELSQCDNCHCDINGTCQYITEEDY